MSIAPYSKTHTERRVQYALHEIATGFRHLLQAAAHNWRQARQRRIDRNAFLTMLTLDDRQLQDIGIRREDVKWASSLPMHFNAALELEKLRKQASR